MLALTVFMLIKCWRAPRGIVFGWYSRGAPFMRIVSSTLFAAAMLSSAAAEPAQMNAIDYLVDFESLRT
jgi:hypothetical protein